MLTSSPKKLSKSGAAVRGFLTFANGCWFGQNFMTFNHQRAVFILLLAVFVAPASVQAQKRKGHPSSQKLSGRELRLAQSRLAEMGYGAGPTAVIAFQKYERRAVNGRLTRAEIDAIVNASQPIARDPGYKHVEVDLDRQVLVLTNADGSVRRVLPVSTGSNKQYREKRMSGLAYTPRGRFRIYAKLNGWRKSPLGLLYYPNYFSDGLAIHGNPSVPTSPQSHGCIRIPMSAAVEMSRQTPVGTILLIYDSQSFVSAKEWAESPNR